MQPFVSLRIWRNLGSKWHNSNFKLFDAVVQIPNFLRSHVRRLWSCCDFFRRTCGTNEPAWTYTINALLGHRLWKSNLTILIEQIKVFWVRSFVARAISLEFMEISKTHTENKARWGISLYFLVRGLWKNTYEKRICFFDSSALAISWQWLGERKTSLPRTLKCTSASDDL